MYDRRGKRQVFFLLFFILGTGCLLSLLWKQNQLLRQAESKSLECLAHLGFEENAAVSWLQDTSEESKERWILDAVPLLSWLAGTQETIARQDQMHEFAMLYPGKSSADKVWSGAAGDWNHGTEALQSVEEAEAQKTSEETAQTEEETAGGDRKDGGTQETDETEQNAVETFVETDADAAIADAAQKENEAYLAQEETSDTEQKETSDKKIQVLQRTMSLNYLLKNFYIVDSSTSIDKKVFDVESLLHTNHSLKKKNAPQIYIFHTHGASEYFADSDPENPEESVIGVGGYLADLLEKKYGYQVIHDETAYDRIHGKIDRNKAYNKAADGLEKALKKYPSIQVVIDLHRDGVGNQVHRLTTVNGKKTAQIMFFNGLSRNRKGDIKYLKNENLQENLSFSLQMKMKCMELYPNLARPVYLKSYRYNLHMRKRSLLIELGNENNTLAEARNAMEPLANVLNQVLSGK